MKIPHSMVAAAHICPIWVRCVFAGTYLLLIAWLSLATSAANALLPEFPGADKAAHVVLYGGLGVVLRWVFWDALPRYRTAVLVLAGALAYGAIMEVMQAAFTDGMRAFEWWDMAADVLGAAGFWFWAGAALRYEPESLVGL